VAGFVLILSNKGDRIRAIMDLLANLFSIFYFLPDIFLNFNFSDFLDILIVTLIFYIIFLFIKQTNSYVILNVALGLFLIYYIARILDLSLIRQFFQPFLAFIIVILVVVFQGELRKFIRWVSAPTKFHFNKFFKISENSMNAIVKATEFMSDKKIGALMVFKGEQDIGDLLNGGVGADAEISTPLILSIFDSHTPGHDGAIIFNNNRIKKFGVHLPLAENYSGYSKAGLRHRAGVGISEQSDVLVLIVSEERGTISVSENGQIELIQDGQKLRKKLLDFYKENQAEELTWRNFWYQIVIRNFGTKLISFILAGLMWFFLVFQSGVMTKEIQVPVEIRFLPKDFVVEEISHKNIEIVVIGNHKDLNNFEPRGNQIVIDGRNLQNGINNVVLDQNMFNLPNYLNVKTFEPKEIKIDLLSNVKPSEEGIN
jgi:diadenylate cyclase